MPAVGRPAALGPARHAGRLVAGEALLGLSVSPGARPPSRAPRKKKDPPPPAPWGSFPLSELVVFVAIVLIVGGLFVQPPRRNIMLGAGLALGSLAGLELSVREHFAGYRSHTLLLSGACGIAALAAVLALSLPPLVALISGAAAFGLGAWLFTRAFKRRAGGATFRVR